MGVGGTISGYMDGVSGWNENGDGRGTAGDRTPPNGEGKLAAPAPVPIADRPPLPMPPPPWPLPYPPLSRAVASWKPPPKWPASSGDGSAMGDGKTWPPASEAEGRRLPLTLPTPPALPPTPPALLPGPMALPHPPPPTPRYDNNVCGVVAPDVGSPPLPTALGRAWRPPQAEVAKGCNSSGDSAGGDGAAVRPPLVPGAGCCGAAASLRLPSPAVPPALSPSRRPGDGCVCGVVGVVNCMVDGAASAAVPLPGGGGSLVTPPPVPDPGRPPQALPSGDACSRPPSDTPVLPPTRPSVAAPPAASPPPRPPPLGVSSW